MSFKKPTQPIQVSSLRMGSLHTYVGLLHDLFGLLSIPPSYARAHDRIVFRMQTTSERTLRVASDWLLREFTEAEDRLVLHDNKNNCAYQTKPEDPRLYGRLN